jgi:hypothetical protein
VVPVDDQFLSLPTDLGQVAGSSGKQGLFRIKYLRFG